MIFIGCHRGDIDGHDNATSKNDENDNITSSFPSNNRFDDVYLDVTSSHSKKTSFIDFDSPHVNEMREYVSFTDESDFDFQSNESRLEDEPRLDELNESKIIVYLSLLSDVIVIKRSIKKNVLLKKRKRTIN